MFKNKGFTLIELLVVIGIIALLASIVMVQVTKTRARARDAERVSEIKSIQNALALYSTNSGGNFPPIGGPFPYGPIPLTNTDPISVILKNAGTISAIPADPVDSGFYVYTYEAPSATSYVLRYYLETDSVLGKDGAEGGTSGNPQTTTP